MTKIKGQIEKQTPVSTKTIVAKAQILQSEFKVTGPSYGVQITANSRRVKRFKNYY